MWGLDLRGITVVIKSNGFYVIPEQESHLWEALGVVVQGAPGPDLEGAGDNAHPWVRTSIIHPIYRT